jgi:hypothetical protein
VFLPQHNGVIAASSTVIADLAFLANQPVNITIDNNAVVLPSPLLTSSSIASHTIIVRKLVFSRLVVHGLVKVMYLSLVLLN